MRSRALAVLCLSISACSTSSSNFSPTLTVLAPASPVVVAPGTPVQIDYVDQDEVFATTSLFAVPEDDPNDQIVIELDRPGGDGTTQTVMWDTSGVAPGVYTILGETTDGHNSPVSDTAPGTVTIN